MEVAAAEEEEVEEAEEVEEVEKQVLAEEVDPEAQVAAAAGGGGERRKYVNRVDYLCIYNFITCIQLIAN